MEQLVVLQQLDTPDAAGVVFPWKVVEPAVDAMNKQIEEKGGVMGECGILVNVPSDRFLSIDINSVSHLVKHVWNDSGVLKAKIKLLGKYAELAEDLGLHFSAMPRAFGDFDAQRVCTSYTLVTIDIELPEI